MSAGDLALMKDDSTKAIELYTSESAAPGEDQERAHDGLVRALIEANRIPEAEANVKTWTAASPADAWTLLAKFQVAYRKAEMTAASEALLASLNADPCNAEAHAEFARYAEFSGLHATAKKQLEMAHSLEPENLDITRRLSRYQPHEQVAGAPSCKLVTPVTSTKIPYRALQDGPHAKVVWGLDVGINGKPRRMEIDTGASGLLLTKAAAAALNLVPTAHYMTGGVGDEGKVASFSAKVQSIRIGGLEFQDCEVSVLSTNPNFDGDGLIGGDVFRDFLLTLDFPGRELRLDLLPQPPQSANAPAVAELATGSWSNAAPMDRYIDPSMAKWARTFRAGHNVILPVRLNQGPTHLFIMDTGSGLDLISPEAAREVGHVHGDSNYEITGVEGKVKKVYSTGPITMEFAGVRKPSYGMTSIDTSTEGEYIGAEISGFIGAETLQQLTVQIDYRDNLVHFSYDPKRLLRCVDNMEIPGCI
jgi:predicted aspartyl protease